MSAVRLEGVSKRFGETRVVTDISVQVQQGELLALLGPSGSGKTTLLRLIAGFESADAGRIHIGGQDVTALDALGRRCGMVFQHYALFPHMNVAENVGYGLEGAGLGRVELTSRVSEALAMVDLAGLEQRPVTALSGGQQQRVALARAIAPRPAVLLLDEPLSNLDPTLRERTRDELRELLDRIGMTAILVTHEQEEAFALADRVALLMHGRLAQVGTPEELYLRPASLDVAHFIGRATTVRARLRETSGETALVEALGTVFEARAAAAPGQAPALVLRPEALVLAAAGPIAGAVLRRRFTGLLDHVMVDVDGEEIEVVLPAGSVQPGERIRLAPSGAGAFLFGGDA
ncbi:MAG TPA: ABC transporter ATP-binding protein [Gemmatimonadales bacterium]|nr:ABC transporter ATP-binding protein [Gemmatimonadales bacterium]